MVCWGRRHDSILCDTVVKLYEDIYIYIYIILYYIMVCWGRRHDVILYEVILYIYKLWCVGGADVT